MNVSLFNWTTGMKKLAIWIAAGAGLEGAQVKYVGQGGQPPTTPWISAKLITTNQIGTDQVRFLPNPLVLLDRTIDSDEDGVDATANTLLVEAHAYVTGDGPVRFTTTGTLPGSLVVATDYWLVVVDENTVKIAASRAAAVAVAPTTIDLVDIGIGVHTIVDTADTRRVLAEHKYIAEGHRTAVLSLQCFADDALYGNRSQAILERLRNTYKLPGQQEKMRESRFAIGRMGSVSQVGGSASSSSDLEPRSVLEVFLNYVDGAEEGVTTIESAEMELTIDLPDGPDIVETFTVTKPA